MSANSFRVQYNRLLKAIHDEGATDFNKRTGQAVLVLPSAHMITVDLSTGLLPLCNFRKMNPATAAAEVAWFLQGTKSTEWLEQYTGIWKGFTENGEVEAAYGYRWREHFGRDQIQLALQALINDPSDRRVYISAWDPSADGMTSVKQANVPCPVGFTLNIVNGKLNSLLTIRSSDVFVGLPYDVMGHSMLIAALASELGIKPGTVSFALSHAHIYVAHLDLVPKGILSGDPQAVFESCPRVELVNTSLSHIEDCAEGFVHFYAMQTGLAEWPAFNPRPEVFV